MKLLIDDADVNAIRRLYEYYPIKGVTTNPSILAAAGRPPYEVLKEIRSIIGADADLHVQTVASDCSGIIDDAHEILRRLGDGTLVKIPCMPEGFKAMKQLKREGVRLTGTAVYTSMQAYMAAECGAEYVAPYVNRIDNMGYDGAAVVRQIQDIFDNNAYETGILAASFKNTQQLLELCSYGIAAATAAPGIIDGMFSNASVNAAVEAFRKDFERAAGDGLTMSTTNM
ncbi:MAG: transaldolase family protein [Clostridiales bacterium]|nr:transaldolase family protein [Clostridiales bacterium]MDO5141018.1 transaldolase family protein [Eubacteriales bacterium]